MNLGIEENRDGGILESEPVPSLWHQLEAFRELLQEGQRLLGEVLVFTRNAELSADTLQREKSQLDAEREALWQDRQRFLEEVRVLGAKVCEQEQSLASVRAELRASRGTVPLREQPPVDEARLQQLERRLQGTEEELQQTRRILVDERERRNRAISLIRPGGPDPVVSRPVALHTIQGEVTS